MLTFYPFRRLMNLFGFRTHRPPAIMMRGKPIDLMEPQADDIASRTYDWFKSQLDIAQDRHQRYRELQQMDDGDIISCLPGDTSISLVDGTEVQIQDLVGRDPFWVYSYDHSTSKIVPGRAIAIPTRKNAKLVEVELDNGEKVRCTPDHRWMLRDGSYKRADELEAGESLMPLYRKYDNKFLFGYELLYQPRLGKRSGWHFTHKEFVSGIVYRGLVIHHRDFNKLNNCPENLLPATLVEHASLHAMSPEHCQRIKDGLARRTPEQKVESNRKRRETWAKKTPEERYEICLKWRRERPEVEEARLEAVRRAKADMSSEQIDVMNQRKDVTLKNRSPEEVEGFRLTCIEAQNNRPPEAQQLRAERVSLTKLGKSDEERVEFKQTMRDSWAKRRQKYGPNGRRKQLVNHKVMSVRKLTEREDCYDLQVEEYHNFALTVGVFVHNSALDLYAEDATQLDPGTGRSIWVVSKNKEVEKIANATLERVDMEGRVFSITRGVAKYGDHFESLLLGMGDNDIPTSVAGMKTINPIGVSRIEDELGRLLGFRVSEISEEQQFEDMPQPSVAAGDITLPWEILHFRLMAQSVEDERYGTSMLASSRRVYRYLRLMEESMVIYRLRRAPDRLKWKVYVGSSSPEEAAAIVNAFRQRLRKKMATDPDTGHVKSELNPLALDEDIFIPFGDGPGQHDVDMMKGSTDVGDVLDIDYMRKRLFSCMRIPPDYMGFEEAGGTLSGRSPLSDQDVRFARGEKRLQRAIMEGVTTLIKIDMLLRGMDVEREENEFALRMHPVSFLEELQRVEVAKNRAEIVATLVRVGHDLGGDKSKWMTYVAQQSGFPEELLQSIGSQLEQATTKEEAAEILLEALAKHPTKMPAGNELQSRIVKLPFAARTSIELTEEIERRREEAVERERQFLEETSHD